jgi:hypothetical protein
LNFGNVFRVRSDWSDDKRRPNKHSCLSGEEGGDNEVSVQLLRARLKTGMIDVLLLELLLE